MSKAFVKTTTAYAVTVAVVVAIINQITKGEPRLLPATVSGLAFGITVAAFQYWQRKRGPK